MRTGLSGILASVVAIGFGLIVLLGLVIGEDLGVFYTILNNDLFSVQSITNLLLQITVIAIAVTILLGVVNLLQVHLGRIRRRRGGWLYSIVLVLSTLTVIVLTILERAGILSNDPPLTTLLLENIQVSIESALAGLLLFALVYGAYRVLHRRFDGWRLLFVVTLVFFLVSALPGLGFLAAFRDWLAQVPVSAGARGILLGIGLATVVVGVRVLAGQDRSYRE